MPFSILGNQDNDRLYCTGSFTKLLTTYVCLSKLAENYDLNTIVDDPEFFDSIATTEQARSFLDIFQQVIGSNFSIRDICSYYTGLPYTFDISEAEMDAVDAGKAFKHHSIMDEQAFLELCRHNITPVYAKQSKFHYSEIAIIFFGYFMEKVYDTPIETFYADYIIDKFGLKNSHFSRTRLKNANEMDLSDHYDYPSIAIQDHGYFCYSNGFFTTLNDEATLLTGMLKTAVFKCMTDTTKARAASPRLLNGLTIELRLVGDDIIYGYEGLSYSGCNLFAYSTKLQQGYVAFSYDEDAIYPYVYENFGYTDFDKIPQSNEVIYQKFIKSYAEPIERRPIPCEYRGSYQRVQINEKQLEDQFSVDTHSITIRNPTIEQYEIVYAKNCYRILNKDRTHGLKVGFLTSKKGNRYMSYDGTLYKKIPQTQTA